MSALPADVIERISAEVHEAWRRTKAEQGVTSRCSESGEELMVAYEQLSEPAKNLDRASVLAVLGPAVPILRAAVIGELIADTEQRMTEPYGMPDWERWGLGARLEWLKRISESTGAA